MIDICTATDEELTDRVAHGEEAIDVIEEHSTAIWFVDRAGWRLAWGIVRELASGKKFPPGYVAGCIHECPVSPGGQMILVDPSAHHLLAEVI